MKKVLPYYIGAQMKKLKINLVFILLLFGLLSVNGAFNPIQYNTSNRIISPHSVLLSNFIGQGAMSIGTNANGALVFNLDTNVGQANFGTNYPAETNANTQFIYREMHGVMLGFAGIAAGSNAVVYYDGSNIVVNATPVPATAGSISDYDSTQFSTNGGKLVIIPFASVTGIVMYGSVTNDGSFVVAGNTILGGVLTVNDVITTVGGISSLEYFRGNSLTITNDSTVSNLFVLGPARFNNTLTLNQITTNEFLIIGGNTNITSSGISVTNLINLDITSSLSGILEAKVDETNGLATILTVRSNLIANHNVQLPHLTPNRVAIIGSTTNLTNHPSMRLASAFNSLADGNALVYVAAMGMWSNGVVVGGGGGSGLLSLNGLTNTTQTFTTGTSGTDFGISSSVSTHSFNLPTAAAAIRGALSSNDWTTFNDKVSDATLVTASNAIITSPTLQSSSIILSNLAATGAISNIIQRGTTNLSTVYSFLSNVVNGVATFYTINEGTGITIDQDASGLTINSVGGGGIPFSFQATQLSTNGNILNVVSNVFLTNAVLQGFAVHPEIAEPDDSDANTIRMYASDDNGQTVLNYIDPSGHILQLTRDNSIVALNDQGGPISKGQLVYVSGGEGASGTPKVKLTLADSLTTMPVVGMVMETSIADGTHGRILLSGLLRGLDTLVFSEGDILYASTNVAGGLTNSAPDIPQIRQRIGFVIADHASQGAILFQPLSILNPLVHGGTHTNGGSDEILIQNLGGSLASSQLESTILKNISETGALTNFPYASTIALSTDGNDATAVRGNVSKPYRSWTNALAAVQSGDIMLIYPGDYVIGMASNLISSTLYDKTNVTIIGLGRPKLWATNSHKGVFLNMSNVLWVTIRDLDFMGSTDRDTSNNGLASAVQFSGSNIAHVMIEGNRFDDWAGNVIVHPDAFRGLSSNVVVRANRFYRTGQWNGTAAADNIEGSAIASLGSYSQVVDNYFEDVWRGVEYESPGTYTVINAVVSGNIFNGWKEKGIFNQHSGTADKMIGWVVKDNYFWGWKTNVASHDYGNNFGVKDLTSTDTLIAGNQVIGSRGTGIIISPASGQKNIRPKVIGNTIVDAGILGIQAFQASFSTFITNIYIGQNKIAYVTNSGIQINSVGAEIVDNQILFSSLNAGTEQGIWLLYAGTGFGTNANIRGNRITGSSTERGIRVEADYGNVKIIGNDIDVATPISDATGAAILEEVHTHADALNGGTLAGEVITSGTIADARLSTTLADLSGTGAITNIVQRGTTNLSTIYSVLSNVVNGVATFYTLNEGSNITIDQDASGLTINSTGGSGGPTTSNNIPAGVTIFGAAPATNILMNADVGTLFRVVLTNNMGLMLTNGSDGQRVEIELFQDATGNRTVSHVHNTGGTQTNLWAFGTDITSPITLTTNASRMDRLSLRYISAFGGATNRWDVVGFVRGYPQ
jgi:hypothetical protein